MSSITLKISSLVIRTLSKPIANRIKAQAREHERFRKICISFAQSLHRLDMRLRLGLLQDQAAIDRQIAREAAEHAKAKDIPTVKTEAQTRAEEGGAKSAKAPSPPKPRIRPLSEAKAIDSGANFISEAFLFSVGLGIIVFESWRSRRRENTRRADVAERLQELEEKDEHSWRKVDELERKVGELQPLLEREKAEPRSKQRRGAADAASETAAGRKDPGAVAAEA